MKVVLFALSIKLVQTCQCVCIATNILLCEVSSCICLIRLCSISVVTEQMPTENMAAASYEALEKQVYKDVLRTDRNIQYYRGDDNQNLQIQL